MKVLVTGATGNVGAHVVRALRGRGVAVRAFVRDRDRAAHMLGEDVELAVGDFGDRGSLERALQGAQRMFLACSNTPAQVEHECAAIDAAAAAGLERVVKLSGPAPAVDSPLVFDHWHGQIEAHLKRSGPPWVLLRPSAYMTNLLQHADDGRAHGQLFAPAGAAEIAYIDPRDVGEAAAAALTGDGHDGRAYTLTGPRGDHVRADRAGPLAGARARDRVRRRARRRRPRGHDATPGLPPFVADADRRALPRAAGRDDGAHHRRRARAHRVSAAVVLALRPRPRRAVRRGRAGRLMTATQRWTLTVVCAATAMLMLDIAVVNTALSAIAADLDTGLSGLQWVVDAYTLDARGHGHHRRVAGRPLRPPPAVRRRPRALHRDVAAVRRRAVDHDAQRLARRAGRRRGDHVRGLAGRALARVPATAGAHQGARRLRRDDARRVRDRAAGRRRADVGPRLALDLPDQPAARRGLPVDRAPPRRRVVGPARAAGRPRRPADADRRALPARLRAAARQRAGGRARRSWRRSAARSGCGAAFVAVEARVAQPMLPLRPVPQPVVHRRAGRSVRDLGLAVRAVAVPDAVPAAGPRAVGDRGRAGLRARHAAQLRSSPARPPRSRQKVSAAHVRRGRPRR